MTPEAEEFRQRVEKIANQFFEDFEKRGGPHREKSMDYEKLAIDYSHKGFQTLTFLNGGALVAIPTALAFFKADVSKIDILLTAGVFVVGLVAVVAAQGAAFFTMAKRAEAQDHYKNEQFNRVAALGFPPGHPENSDRIMKAANLLIEGNTKVASSNSWRRAGLFFFGVSLLLFVIGCGLGVYAVAVAKEKTTVGCFT